MKLRDGLCVNVIVDQPGRELSRAFTYLPPRLQPERIQIGSYVLVPFGRQRLPAFVIGFTNDPPPVQLKPILGRLLDAPLFSAQQLEQARWLAQEYECSLGDALRCYLPPGSRRNVRRRVILTTTRPLDENMKYAGVRAPKQRAVVEALMAANGELTLEALRARLGSDPTSALRALEAQGVVELRRELARPVASRKTQRLVALTLAPEQARMVAESKAGKARRQAKVLQTLADAAEPVAITHFPKEAVAALERDGLVRVTEQQIRRSPTEIGLGNERVDDPSPTPEQRRALQAVMEALAQGGGEILLHGVTGSGKTEVYIQAIRQTRERNRSAIVLVPEISLTPQLVGRFRARFGNELALLHSAMGAGERFDEWHRVRSGEARIVIGARSAVFAPCVDLGLLIIDEEHERSYKQERPPRYDARTVAAERCRREGAVLLLGSATPSVETYYRFVRSSGERRIIQLSNRIDDRPLPSVELVDMREETRRGRSGTFSVRLTEAIAECLAADNQAILFLNRRGFSTFVMCRECGYALRCPNCDVSLTYHYGLKHLLCHHCDHHESVPDICPACGGIEIGFYGLGTERVADQVQRDFPNARVIRMDRDTTSTKGAHGDILRRFAAGEANILVGTQMIAKGLDLPNVTLVGVLNADVGLNRPDFRAAEHTFQLLSQVAGRAGRASKLGQVIVQTYNPDHYAIRWASQHDYLSFYNQELERRRQVRGSPYPPFGYLLAIHLSDPDFDKGAARAARLGQELRRRVEKEGAPITVGGPAPAPLSKLRGRYRWLTIPRGPDRAQLRELSIEAIKALPKSDQTSIYIDVDPLDMM
ncbi:MAG: primosomal protein N' [Candidatus Zipacnadales bacterium]